MLHVLGQKVVDIACYAPADQLKGCINPTVHWLFGLDASRPEILVDFGINIIGIPLGISVVAIVSALLQLVQTRMVTPQTDDPQQRAQQRGHDAEQRGDPQADQQAQAGAEVLAQGLEAGARVGPRRLAADVDAQPLRLAGEGRRVEPLGAGDQQLGGEGRDPALALLLGCNQGQSGSDGGKDPKAPAKKEAPAKVADAKDPAKKEAPTKKDPPTKAEAPAEPPEANDSAAADPRPDS